MNQIVGDPPPKNSIVFSDLDGTLLDKGDYSFEQARPALQALKERKIPLVLCSSKTRAEMEIVRGLIGNRDPFIVENGGAIHIPTGYFPFPIDFDRVAGDYLVIDLGTPYARLVQILAELKKESTAALRGFSDMTVEEVSERCALTLDQAARAKRREFDEPFMLLTPGAIPEWTNKRGVSVIPGDRFFHLSGSDKGRAVSRLIALYRQSHPGASTIAIGNGPSDFPMLAAVDIPFLVQTGEGVYADHAALARLRLAGGVGPDGWNTAMMSVLQAPPCGRSEIVTNAVRKARR